MEGVLYVENEQPDTLAWEGRMKQIPHISEGVLKSGKDGPFTDAYGLVDAGLGEVPDDPELESATSFSRTTSPNLLSVMAPPRAACASSTEPKTLQFPLSTASWRMSCTAWGCCSEEL